MDSHGFGASAGIAVSGAAAHIYGAIPRLEKSAGARYVSAPPLKLSLADIRDDPIRAHRSVEETLTNNRVRMERLAGVANILLEFIGRAKPTSVLFIKEDLDVGQKTSRVRGARDEDILGVGEGEQSELGFQRRPWDAFLIAAKSSGMPVGSRKLQLRNA